VRWGFFDTTFEQKEYIESYVIERLAREMLAAQPAVAQEFEEARKDTAFADHPESVRDWFYRRSPYFDTHQNLYPVGRILDRNTVERLRRLSR
jgi:hypothetical protein